MLLPLFLALTVAQNGPACSGADPAIVSAHVAHVTNNGNLKHYDILVVVTNVGTQKQPGNTLQSVNIYRDGQQKMDAKGIPPLGRGQSYQFTYGWDRSAISGNRTTRMTFRLAVHSPASSAVNCNTDDDTFRLTL